MDSTIPDRIREAMAAYEASLPVTARASQARIARAAGVKPSTLWRWLSGELKPPLEALGRLADVLGVSAGWLAYGDGEMRRSAQTPIESTAAVPMDRGPDDSGEGDQPRQVRERGKP